MHDDKFIVCAGIPICIGIMIIINFNQQFTALDSCILYAVYFSLLLIMDVSTFLQTLSLDQTLKRLIT